MREIKKLENLSVQEVLQKIDEQTANEMMKGFSKRYGFKVVEISGKVFTTAKELMRVFGYSDEKAVRKLLNEYDVEMLTIKDLVSSELQVPKLKDLLIQRFELSPQTPVSKLKLLDYRAFLVIALNSKTEKAKEVKEYVINMEKEARQRIVLAQKGITPETLELAQNDPILAMVETIKQVRLKQLELEQRQKELEERQERVEETVKALAYERITSDELLKIQGWINKVAKVWREVKELEGKRYTYREAQQYIKARLCEIFGVKDLTDIPRRRFSEVIARLNKNYVAYRRRWENLKGFRSLLS
ncbi:MAG: hypothetical protein GXO39_04725 [Thermotogae bacterium]|nr:hypothetical protein [Thermotogota bacterium]